MSSAIRTMLALFVLVISSPGMARAQPAAGGAARAQPAPAAPEWVLRVYPVADLVISPPDYPYRGTEIPTTSQSVGGIGFGSVSDGGAGLGGGGFMGGIGGGGFGGGGIGGGGGGFFQVSDAAGGGTQTGGFAPTGGSDFGVPPPDVAARKRFTVDELVQAIRFTIAPESWADVGGMGVCTPLGGLLLIKQTEAAHQEIQELLLAVRDVAANVPTVNIEADWLLLTREEAAQLTTGDAQPQTGGSTVVNRAALEQLATDKAVYHGRITCFSEQTVHLVSGERRSVVTGAVPVVSAESVGYQPIVSVPNFGVLLEVKPTVLSHRQAAVLNLESTVTAAGRDAGAAVAVRSEQPAAGERASTTTIDRVSLDTQHLATTVLAPVGQPVLVGGLSVAGDQKGAADGTGGRQLYLVIEVTVNPAPH